MNHSSPIAHHSPAASIGRGSDTPLSKVRREVSGERLATATAPHARPHTSGHLRAIYALGRKRGLHNDELHDFVLGRLAQNSTARHTGSFKDLTFAEAEASIAALKGKDFIPRRTLQYRRQRAGIQQMITAEHKQLIAALATERNWTPQTLVNFCERQCGHHPLRTTKDANKVIEALKAMNKRDHLWAA